MAEAQMTVTGTDIDATKPADDHLPPRSAIPLTSSGPANLMHPLAIEFPANFSMRSTNSILETPMKKMWIWSLLVLVSAVSLGWSQTGGAEKAVAAQEQLWLQSQKANNPDLVAPLLSDKIVITLADGTVHDKAGYPGACQENQI